MEKKKVLIVASVISFIEWFNKENVAFLNEKLGCEVHLACDFSYMKDTDEARTKAYIEKIRTQGVILHQIPFARSPFSTRNIGAYRVLKDIIEQENFSLIHCHTPVASMLTRQAQTQSLLFLPSSISMTTRLSTTTTKAFPTLSTFRS